MSGKSRNWCFTINNYKNFMGDLPNPEDEKNPYLYKLVETLGSVKYMVIGFEIGKSGTPHIQGYVDFLNPRTLGGITSKIKYAHWEMRKGTWQQAIEYCMKDGDYHVFGERNSQGERSDLVTLKDNIANGLKVDTIVMDDPIAFHQYGRTLNKIEDLAMRKKFRTEMTMGTWYWGRTGVGKSHVAFQDFTPDTHYVYPNDNGWWDGYTQQETVIFNDFRGEVPYNEMLQLIDKFPMTVRRRNREPIPFISKSIIITSSLPPSEVYCKRNDRDSIAQLLRRLQVIELTQNPLLQENEESERNRSDGGGNTEPPPQIKIKPTESKRIKGKRRGNV